MRSTRPILLALVVLTAALGPAVLASPAAAESTATASATADSAITVEHDGDRVTVANGTSQVVRGTADAPVGTEVLVRVRSSGNTTPRFLKTATGVVTENGTWAVAFDFSEQYAGNTFALRTAFEDGDADSRADADADGDGPGDGSGRVRREHLRRRRRWRGGDSAHLRGT